MSVDKFVISKETTCYTTFTNKVLQGLRDAEALGLWCYLASLAPDWNFYKDTIRTHFKIGRDKLDSLLSVLKSHNLIEIHPIRNESGKFIKWRIHVCNGELFSQTEKNENTIEINELNEIIQNTEKPPTGKPHQWKTAAINKINKTNTIKSTNKTLSASDIGFEKFWSKHPIKKNRIRTKKIWDRENYLEILPLILEDLDNRIKFDSQWQNKQYIPHPYTYLINRLWTDEITPCNVKNGSHKESGAERALRMCLPTKEQG